MKIHKTDIPPRSLLTPCLPGDYHDCFTYGMTCRRKLSPDDLMVAFWTTMPGWADTLFKLRNALVRPFGLQADNGDAKQLEKAIRSGRDYRMMSVVGKTDNETVISLDDKHLKAYLSVYAEAREIHLSTLVRYHNRLGFFYFNLIRPFHTLVVKSTFRRIIKAHGL